MVMLRRISAGPTIPDLMRDESSNTMFAACCAAMTLAAFPRTGWAASPASTNAALADDTGATNRTGAAGTDATGSAGAAGTGATGSAGAAGDGRTTDSTGAAGSAGADNAVPTDDTGAEQWAIHGQST
jgi:hypothetical protein